MKKSDYESLSTDLKALVEPDIRQEDLGLYSLYYGLPIVIYQNGTSKVYNEFDEEVSHSKGNQAQSLYEQHYLRLKNEIDLYKQEKLDTLVTVIGDIELAQLIYNTLRFPSPILLTFETVNQKYTITTIVDTEFKAAIDLLKAHP